MRVINEIDRSAKYVRSLVQMMMEVNVLEHYTKSTFQLVKVGALGHKLLGDPKYRLEPLRLSNELRQEHQQGVRRDRERAREAVARAEREKLGSMARAANASTTGITSGNGNRNGNGMVSSQPSSQPELTPKEQSLLTVLVDLRKVESTIKGIAPYQVFGR
jgi:hypothetical protein